MAQPVKLILLICLLLAPVYGEDKPRDYFNQGSWEIWSLNPFGNGSAVFSPLGLFRSLGILSEASRGDAQQQISKLYHQEPPQLQETALDVQARLQRLAGKSAMVHVGTRLWVTPGRPLLPVFQKKIARNYSAQAVSTNFANFRKATHDINAWAAAVSNRQITTLLRPGDVTSSSELVLTDVVSFHGVWESPFDASRTQPGTFHGQAADVRLPMMHKTGKLRCLIERQHNITGLSVVELPYKGGNLALDIFVPNPVRSEEDLEKELTMEAIAGYLERLEMVNVELTLPRFHVRSRCELQRPLEQLGMTTMWAGGADLSGAFGNSGSLRLSRCFQEVVVDVNERGTIAAAATAAVVTRDMKAEFAVDRPFLFVIRDRQTNMILFLGRFLG